MTMKELKKLSKEDKLNLVKERKGNEISKEFINIIADEELKVMVNGTDIYDVYKNNDTILFRYGKHPKQAKTYGFFEIKSIQVIGTTI